MAALWTLAAAASLAKLLFIPSYRSTDFEVHRNWLAITYSQPLSRWYYEETSEWTLDYPPFFAWFECLLAFFAQFADPAMLKVNNLNYASDATVMFQRISVIVTDFVYYYAVKEFQEYSKDSKSKTKLSDFSATVIPALLIFNVGLFIVDHIHFQYNGILFGVLLLSITRLLQGRNIEGAFWFSVLLNMKHIFLYVAPAYFVYLLRTHCFQANKPISLARFSFKNFASLASVVGVVFLLSFGPFIYLGQVGQVLSRLFPFKRGLVHAYWAPNFWALYSGLDKVLTVVGVRMGLVDPSEIPVASMTGGRVQEYSHVVLPSIGPGLTLLFVILGMMPALFVLWQQRTPLAFLRTLILCAFTSFLFGWHVHEKAILLVIIPLILLVLYDEDDARLYLILSTAGFYSLFPLIYTPFENILKVLLLIQSCMFSFLCLGSIYQKEEHDRKEDHEPVPTSLSKNFLAAMRPVQLPLLNLSESLYVLGLIPLGFVNTVGFWLLSLDQRLPFLPLMLTSLYCALGVVYTYSEFYRLYVRESIFRETSRVVKIKKNL